MALTGGSGFIGRLLVSHLLASGHGVTALARSPGSASLLKDLGAHVVAGDVTSRSSLNACFAGADVVFHLAGYRCPGDLDTETAWAVNVQGTRNAVDAAREACVTRFMYTSTLAVNSDTRGEVPDEQYEFAGRHLSLHELTRAHAHRIVSESLGTGMEIVIVMPGTAYGPGDPGRIGDLIRRTAAGRRVLVPAGLKLCPTYVTDIVEGHMAALTKGNAGESYILAGAPVSGAEMLSHVATLTGTQPPLVIPDAAVALASRGMGWLGRHSRTKAESLRTARASYLGTSEKAARELGWQPRDLIEGLAGTLKPQSPGRPTDA